MSLATVAFPAPTPQGLEEWLWAHLIDHQAINAGIKQKYGLEVQDLPLWPVNLKDPRSVQIFLQSHQSAHNEIGAILGVAGNDLANVDFLDEDQRKSFFFLNLQQHRAAKENLGMGL